MKRLFFIMSLALLGVSATAQNYIPLGKVSVPETHTTKVHVNKCSYMNGETYYKASHHMGRKYMTADLQVPANCDMAIPLLPNITQGMTAKLSVGGVDYYLTISFVIDESFYIDLLEDHIRHIAVSGLQSITFMNSGTIVQELNFPLHEQEIWRRTAEELGKAAYIII